MAKFDIQKGDKIRVRYSHTRDENDGTVVCHGEEVNKPLEVTKVWNHGVRTKGHGYVHNNRILSKIENQ